MKTGFKLGLGEQESEVRELLSTLAGAVCAYGTIGHICSPVGATFPWSSTLPLRCFPSMRSNGEALGLVVSAGPFVRVRSRRKQAIVWRSRERQAGGVIIAENINT